MNRIKSFRNPSQFNQIFGIVERDNGTKSRRNGILLTFYKSKKVWAYARKYNKYDEFFSITSMLELKYYLLNKIQREMGRDNRYPVYLMGETYFSNVFETDECEGIPSNGLAGYVRYMTHEKNREGKVYKMKAGRFYKRLLLETELGNALPEQVLNWLCEEFTNEWTSYVTRRLPNFTLNIDDDFERIYSYGNGRCTYEFGSCMMDDNQHRYYNDCVKAKAASLVNEDGNVIARCVIFTDVKDTEGNTWRLAERQYSQGGSDLLKRCLVDALIEAKEIDGYKQVGVDCHATNSYVSVNGEPLYDKQFSIDCNLETSIDDDDADDEQYRHILSYQDSFKFYDYKKKKAFNYCPVDWTYVAELDTTCHYLESTFDDYNQEECFQIKWVYFKGEQIKCNRYKLTDFIEYEGEWIHKDDFVECPICGGRMPNPKYHSSMPFLYSYQGKYVCSHDCKSRLRQEIMQNSFYDDLLDEHVSKDENTPIRFLYMAWGEVLVKTTSLETFISKLINGKFIFVAGTNHENGNAMVVPMWAANTNDPQGRYEAYVARYPLTVEIAVLKIHMLNASENIDIDSLIKQEEILNQTI